MTWLEFKKAVKELLPVDAERLNVAGPYLESLIRQGVIDLQSLIPELRTGNETVYGVSDFTTEEYASVGTMPVQAEPRDAYYVSSTATDPCNRKPLVSYDWGNRYDLICANIQVPGCHFAISIDPYGKTFYVFPEVVEGRQVELSWDARAIVYEDSNPVVFDEECALPVADFCEARIRRKVDNDIGAFNSLDTSYRLKRRQLYTDMRNRRRFKNVAATSQKTNSCGNQVCSSC